MGSVYRSTCYPDALAAASAFCAGEYPRTTTMPDGSVRVESCAVASGSELVVSSAASGASAAQSVPVAFTSCDPGLHYREVAEIGVLGLGAVIVVYALRLPLASVLGLFKDH